MVSSYLATLGLLAADFLVASAGAPLTVATLSEHDPTAWSGRACTDTSRGRIACNLRLYEAAIAAAAWQNASLLVMPEGYGLSVTHSRHDYFDPWISEVGSTPRTSGSAAASPQQVRLSAAAARHGVAVVANIFVALANGTRRISDVVLDANGTVLAAYHKHHLFPGEGWPIGHNSPGPFNPTGGRAEARSSSVAKRSRDR